MTSAIASSGATPMMQQYMGLKAEVPAALLLFRMGDFYELFLEDAAVAAGALDIALTHRGQHMGQPLPMCGVPIHAHEAYVARLVKAGHAVAIAEQTEDPAEAKKRGSKSVVARDVVRLVTPGTITEETLLEPGRPNYLAAIARLGGSGPGAEYAIAWTDLSTGHFRIAGTDRDRLSTDISALEPSELIYPDQLSGEPEIVPLVRRRLRGEYEGDTTRPKWPDPIHPADGLKRLAAEQAAVERRLKAWGEALEQV